MTSTGLVKGIGCLTLKYMKQLALSSLIFLLLFVVSIASFGSDFTTTFNTPGFTGVKTTTVEDRLISLIAQASPNSKILVSMYDFDRMPLAKAFIEASKRGVSIRFVFDGSIKKLARQDGSAVNTLTHEMICKEEPCFKYCKSLLGIKNSCRGKINNHNKFVLFSKLDNGGEYVSVLSSANWTEGQLNNANDLLEINNDKKLFDGLTHYWNAILKEKSATPLVVNGDKALVYTFPNTKFDPVLELLNRVSCRIPGSTVRIAQSRFTNSRIEIANRLKELTAKGCDVKVIVREEPDMKSPGTKITDTLGDLMVDLPFHDTHGDDVVKNSIHPKIVLVDAAFDDAQTKTQVVLAGSHNLNSTSLDYNDELLAQVVDKTVYANYLAFWNKIISDARDAGIIH